MAQLTDEVLVKQSLAGNESAFLALLRRYEAPLASLIRHHVGESDDAQDVMQNTVVAAWCGLRTLRDPGKVCPWLLQVARNRCRDYFKATQRRDEPTENEVLEGLVNRTGRALARDAASRAAARAALEGVPGPPGDTARLFYLDGLTIAEIAARIQCPEGTVKRRLHHARAQAREALGVSKAGKRTMSPVPQKSPLPPFPAIRPEIACKELDTVPFAVDCPELRWWAIVPEVGQIARWAASLPMRRREGDDRRACLHGPRQ